MNPPRITIATVAFFIALLAIDCSLVRVLTPGSDPAARLGVQAALMMANILPVSLWRIARSRGHYTPFLFGFSVFGLASAVGQIALFRWQPYFGYRYQYFIEEGVGGLAWAIFPAGIERDFLASVPYALALVYLFVIPTVVASIALPQIVIALAGGLLARRSGRMSQVL